MGTNTYVTQFKTLVRRNLLLKRKNPFQLIKAFILPVVITFYFLYEASQPRIKLSTRVTEYDLPLVIRNQDEKGIIDDFNLCVAPRNIEDHFLKSIQASLSSYWQKGTVQITKVEDDKHLKERLLKSYRHNASDCDAGVTIAGNISTTGCYIVSLPDEECLLVTKYCYKKLSIVQQAVDNAFFQEWTGDATFQLPPTKVIEIYDDYEAARNIVNRILKLLFLIFYIPLIINFTANAFHEKNRKIRESIFVIGTKPISYWSAWLLSEVLVVAAVSLLITIALLIVNMASTNAVLHFLLWFGFGCNLVVYAMTLTRLCFRPLIVDTIVIFVLLFPATADIFKGKGGHRTMGLSDYLCMLAPPIAYQKGFYEVMREQDSGEASTAVLMMFIDFFMFCVMDFCLEYLFPYGISIPWRRLRFTRRNLVPKKCDDVLENESLIGSMSSTNLDPYIKIEDVRKAYSCCFYTGGNVLDGLTFSIYKGEMTCLLGHNGAGKSTLMKVISKVLTPDEGRITKRASLNLGVCPQENNLHDELTTYEHLRFFGSLKGIPNEKLDLRVTTLLESFDLLNKRDTRTKELSRGQKRQLCVAIAMIGDPEVLLLDEPSNGMNPQSQRQLWSLLQEYTRAGRSVLFTTHYMDEAELFSDRMVHLNYGKLTYFGATMDLKKFNGGYNVRITLPTEISLGRKLELLKFINDLPSKPKVILTSDSKIDVKLQSFDAAHCTEFFKKLEEQFEDIGPDNFNISVTSLEEIFCLLAEKNTKKSDEKKTAHHDDTAIPKFSYTFNTITSINELIRARYYVVIRNVEMILPILVPILIFPWIRFWQVLIKQSNEMGAKLQTHEILQVINASGKPLTDFENSLYKLGTALELLNSSATVEEKDFMKTEIQNYEIFNESMEISWNWTYSLRSPYSLSALQNLIANVLWKTWDDKLGRELNIIVQPITLIERDLNFWRSELLFSLMHISAGLLLVTLALGTEVVKEKQKNFVWLISRIKNNALAYWVSTFGVQFALLSLSLFVLQILFLFSGFCEFQNFSLWVAFYLTMPGCLLTAYVIGQRFENNRNVDVVMLSTGITTIILFSVFHAAVFADVPYVYLLNILALFLFPIYAPFGLIIILYENREVESVTDGLQWKIVCGLVIPLSNIFYASLIMYLGKWKIFMAKEKVQIMNQEAWNKVHDPKSIATLKSVRKTYASKQCSLKKKETKVIKDLTASFHQGEIFALMGGNESGKSTLMDLLSLNEELTSGEIFIRDKYIESTTLCPEENTLWPKLTVEEHLRLFAVLNGVPVMYAQKVAKKLMKDLLLKHIAERRVGFISIGSQRKLSIALSLLGNSNLVLLDEPTTGMDPLSKKYLWKKLHKEFPATSNRTLIFTTQSANEAEMNCTRIGLLMNGNFRCLGNGQALKKEFGNGFELTVKLKNGDRKKFNAFLVTEIPEVFDKTQGNIMLQYYIPKQAFKLMSELFMILEKIQAFEGVEDCFVTECPLNQIIQELLSQDNTKIPGDYECAV